MKKIVLVQVLFFCIVPIARGDPGKVKGDIDGLISIIKVQNELIADNNQLLSGGYSKTNTDLQKILSDPKMKKYFEQHQSVADNSEAVKISLYQVKESLDKLTENLEKFDDRIRQNEQTIAVHNEIINRNNLDITRLWYVVAAVAAFLAGFAWRVHRGDDSA